MTVCLAPSSINNPQVTTLKFFTNTKAKMSILVRIALKYYTTKTSNALNLPQCGAVFCIKIHNFKNVLL